MIWWVLGWSGIGLLAVGGYGIWRSWPFGEPPAIKMTDKRYRELLEVTRRQDHER